MESGADLQEARNPPAQPNPPRGRLRDAADDLEQGALAGAVLADDADHLSALDLEAHVLEGPELLDLVALHDLSATNEIDPFSCEIASLTRDHVAQRGVPFAPGRLVADQIALRKILDSDDNVGHRGRTATDQM